MARHELAPVLTWQQHDARHRRRPDLWSLAGMTSAGYVLDETDTPGLLYCHRCGARVLEPEGENA